MSGDAANARLWANADVYVAWDPDDAPLPANEDAAFGPKWDLVGLLDGDDGFTHSRSEDVNDHFAWGGVLMATKRSNFKYTVKFAAFEDNYVTHRLSWPGSDTPGTLVVPNSPERVKVAFEKVDGDYVHRLISYYQAEITVDGDVTENEPDMAKVPFLVTIFPDGNGNLFTEQPGHPGS